MSQFSLSLPSSSYSAGKSSTTVVFAPLPLAAILDHHVRRKQGQDRVFGTLLGTRTDGEIHVKSAFGVPYAIKKSEVNIDTDHHKALLDMHLKINPKEAVVGWYSTSPALNFISGLVHGFYMTESAPFPAVHVTLDPETLAFAAYTASPINLTPRADQLAFLPLQTALRVPEQERAGLNALASNVQSIAASDASPAPPAPLASLASLLSQVSTMLDQVLAYVQDVADGKLPPNEKIGRALLETVGAAPAAEPAAIEEEWTSHLEDILMVSYLANVIKAQADIGNRVNLLA